MRTNVPLIFAIGDVVGQPMLAHKGRPDRNRGQSQRHQIWQRGLSLGGERPSLGRDECITKGLFNEEHRRIIRCGIGGPSAGDLVAKGLTPPTSGHTIHPHPTLSETIGMAAEAFEGTITDLYIPKKK
jgi:dihydrolipoamide dehydrogenase